MKVINVENKTYLNILISLFSMTVLLSCNNNDYTPKPRGYFRIDLPKKEYRLFDSSYPYTFEYPSYAYIIPDTLKGSEPYWMDVAFPHFKGSINISYKVVKNNLSKYSEDARTFVNKHIYKATAINEKLVRQKDKKVYGIIYDIEGTATASSMQFVLTDSIHNFLRAALYFYASPNNDSLAPVLDFIKQDAYHLIETFRWKEISNKNSDRK